MITVGQLLKKKGNDVWSVPSESTVLEALRLMADKNIGALMVVDSGETVGIFSERDYARCVALKGLTAENTHIRDVMTEHVLFIRPEQSVDECMALMTDKHIRHLPVMSAGHLAGIISIGDVVKEVISEQEFTIHNLENYITGGKH
ncbi:MAG: CBS domain-containing protein [Anaerolineaceae bacterium]|nr:CBS domain-containing protein [Anaerolineaceae bacterium]